ncbi:MAG: L-seryl-tRNA(Sec) selenium transferase, partial [Candidatus Eisenbacteria bacterium]
EGATAPPRPLVVEAARSVLASEREALGADAARAPEPDEDRLARVVAGARSLARPRQERVINATGVVLHTNLGRAPLSAAARAALAEAAGGYLALEYDVARGKRSERDTGVEEWLVRLTGAEAAMAVNNGAAALLLAVWALAQGKQVIVSRGELIEIGGSFRLPEILARAGATLVEVGTTNRTRIDDYRRALTADTALLLRVHPSNFRLVGFHERPAREEMAALAREANLPLVEDVGSGALVATEDFGLEHEPTVAESLTGGADIVTFSGDKLLGGPQAGLIVGRRTWIERLKRDPLARALRVDKLTVAALEATLAAYVDPARARQELPVLAQLGASAGALDACAAGLAQAIRAALDRAAGGASGWSVDVVPVASEVGGGALPGAALPTSAVALSSSGRSAAALEQRLRLGRPPIVARIRDDKVLLDARTLLFEDPAEVAQLVCAAATGT